MESNQTVGAKQGSIHRAIARAFRPPSATCITGECRVSVNDLKPGFDFDDAAADGLIDATNRLPLGGCKALDTEHFSFAVLYVVRGGWTVRREAA